MFHDFHHEADIWTQLNTDEVPGIKNEKLDSYDVDRGKVRDEQNNLDDIDNISFLCKGSGTVELSVSEPGWELPVSVPG